MVLPNMFNERPEILMLFHADVYTFHDKKLSYYKREKIMELMSLVAHPLICQCAKVGNLNFEDYVICICYNFLCLLLTEKINLLLVKEENYFFFKTNIT